MPRLLREARDRGWWDPFGPVGGRSVVVDPAVVAVRPVDAVAPTIEASVDAATWARLGLAHRVIAPFDAGTGHAIVAAALLDGATVSAGIVGSVVVGLALVDRDGVLLALGVAPAWRREGLATALLRVSAAQAAEVTVAERDPVDPVPHRERASIARRLFASCGFSVSPAEAPVRGVDPAAIVAARTSDGGAS